MAEVKKYPAGSMYGIELNDGTWMKCVNGEDWYSSKEICEEIVDRVIDETVAKTPEPPIKNKVPSEAAMNKAHRRQVRLNAATRRYAKRARGGNTVKY